MHAENELFDAACDVLVATRRLEVAARVPGYGAALTATLGCLASGLGSLAVSVADMRAHESAHNAALNELAETLQRAVRLADGARCHERANFDCKLGHITSS